MLHATYRGKKRFQISGYHQSGHKSSKAFPSSSGESFCFIQRSGTCDCHCQSEDWHTSQIQSHYTHKREITLHSTEEPLPVLFRCDNCRLALPCPCKECRFLDPTFKLLVPCVCSNVVWNKISCMLFHQSNLAYRRCLRRAHSLHCQHRRPVSSP